jgi:hypothetical protein
MIDTATETLVTLGQAAQHYPSVNGRKPHVVTVFRHAVRGINGAHLETTRVGGRTVTSVQAVERFLLTVRGRGGSATGKSDLERHAGQGRA